MTQPGGPAAINGFLYQIVQHLGWLADVTLIGEAGGQGDACLVLEPRQGGDARAEASGLYLVEQYKTRPQGTWSLTDLEPVLRDLRKAVPRAFPAYARYRFVTDGRPGRLDAFMAFLAEVRLADGPDDLDDTEERSFSADVIVTSRTFFDRLVVATRSPDSNCCADERQIVFHLLARFDVEFGASFDAQATAVEKLLRRLAPDLGAERNVREHLVGLLVERLSKGEARFRPADVDALFGHVGLNPDRLRNLARLAERMSALTARRLAPLRYRRELDVRVAPHWPDEKPVLVITGESGVGKTWQLGRLIEILSDAGRTITMVHPASTTEATLARAARDVWQEGLGETSEKTLPAIARFYREIASEAPAPWLIIALDDVQDVDLARDLVRQDWARWGMRLALTVPTFVARALELSDGDVVHVHRVDEFSVDELDTLLRQRGQKWADLPSDLKKLLRSPILAGLFLELPYQSVQAAPRSEYEIFERFWQRITARGRPGDEGIILALAGHMREGKAYPLPRPNWHEIGLTDEAQLARLQSAGWLRCHESGDLAFAHDRLLNWAVAKWLVHKHERKEFSIETLCTMLLGTPDEQQGRLLRRLGYVPMDVLWLIAGNGTDRTEVGALVAELEESREFGSYGSDLYEHLLPTLGQRAVPILLERLGTIVSAGAGDHRVGLIGKGFASLAQQEAIELDDFLGELLASRSRDRQAVAITALTATPASRHLDRLWELHQERVKAFDAKTGRWSYLDYQASFEALRAGTAHDREWLQQRILASDPQTEPVSELTYLLFNLEGSAASDMWQATGDLLMVKVPASKPRSLLYCIARFRDKEKLEFVLACLTRQEDFASGAALRALTLLDPAMAIERFADVEEWERYLTRNNWLPNLLRAEPALTRRKVTDLAHADPKGRRMIENFFWERPDDLDVAMLQHFLRDLEKELRSRFETAVKDGPGWLDHSLSFLGRVARPELLALLLAEAGSELERMITDVACSRLPNAGAYRDHVRENARRVLTLINGDGITNLVNRELASDGFWGRHGGLKWAYVRPDQHTREQLAAIAARPLSRDENGKPDSNGYQEFYAAMIALGAIGADAALVEATWAQGASKVPTAVADLRAHKKRMEKSLTASAAEVLASTTPTEEDVLATALVVAGMSADPDFIPAVRGVLAREKPESRIAGLAAMALRDLGDMSADLARLVAALLPTEKNNWIAVSALLTVGEHGARLLAEGLKDQTEVGKHQHDVLAIRGLYDNPATRKAAIDLAMSRSRRGSRLVDAPYDIAAEANDTGLREQIFDKAFAGRAFVVTETLRAIEGLAKFDSTRAIEAIEFGLRNNPAVERELCRLLVRIAPELAASKLIDIAIEIERDSLRNAVGRALRALDRASIEPLVLAHGTMASKSRKAVAEIAGWLPSPTIETVLRRLADEDEATEVQHSAQIALDRHTQERTARDLLTAFARADHADRWPLFVALLELADPYLLTIRDDPLWLGHVLHKDVPEIFAHHAEQEISRRKQKMK